MRRYADGEPLDLVDLPYRLLRALVAARHGMRPGAVDGWPADEFGDALAVIGVAL
jgi:hypothetical protein